MKRTEWMAVPKPVFDNSKEVSGYYLSYQLENALTGRVRELIYASDTYLPVFDFVNETGLDTLTLGNMLFVPITNALLAMDIESLCKAERSLIALLLDNKIELNDRNQALISRHRELGYKIAFYDVDIQELEEFLDHTDYVFVNVKLDKVSLLVDKCRRHGAKIIAMNVDSNNSFNVLRSNGIGLFEGSFYKIASDGKHNTVSPLQVNYFQLLNDLNSDEFDVDSFAKVISRDTYLAFNFLKMVNSVKNWSAPIKNLRQAASLIGQKEIKRWITTSVASALSQDKPSEVTKISLVRAKFCENVAGLLEMGGQRDNLFLMGLFSVLDAVLDMPFEQALGFIALPDKVKDALLGKANDYKDVLDFVRMYERGEWTELSRIALIKEISISDIFDAYHEALIWYGNLMNMQVEGYTE